MPGLEQLKGQERANGVQAMFDGIAGHYDSVNDCITGGMHRYWRRLIIAQMAPVAGERALDLATGTGDLAIALAGKLGAGKVIGLDFSANMLTIARARTSDVDWLQGDMLALPFPDASFDLVTVGFGLRNVADLDVALQEIARVLKPGGRFGSLETGHPRGALMRGVAKVHGMALPLVGRLVAGDGTPYQYLHDSAAAFVDQDTLATRCRAVGLEAVTVRDLTDGALAIVTGRKPISPASL